MMRSFSPQTPGGGLTSVGAARTGDFYHAGAYFVCFLIMMGSAVIPLSKHLFMLWALVVKMSPRWEQRRHVGLVLFDQLNRTAFVDLFLMGYVICVFFTRVDQSLWATPTLRIQLVNLPVRGIFFGIVSTVLSGALGQFLTWKHNQQQMGDFEHQVTVATGPPTASLMHRLLLQTSEDYNSTRRRVGTRVLACLVTLLLVAGVVLLPMLPEARLVSFQLQGLAGKVAQEGWMDFGLMTVVRDMTRKSESPAGTRFLVFLHVVTTLVVPSLLLGVALVVWFVPLHLRAQRVVLSLFPFCFSWCALDTFLITTVAAYLELYRIGQFTFDSRFHDLCAAVRDMANLECVDLGHRAYSGLYIVGAACIVFFLIFVLVARLGAQLLETAKVASESPNTLLWARPWERESPLLVPSWGLSASSRSASLLHQPQGPV